MSSEYLNILSSSLLYALIIYLITAVVLTPGGSSTVHNYT